MSMLEGPPEENEPQDIFTQVYTQEDVYLSLLKGVAYGRFGDVDEGIKQIADMGLPLAGEVVKHVGIFRGSMLSSDIDLTLRHRQTIDALFWVIRAWLYSDVPIDLENLEKATNHLSRSKEWVHGALVPSKRALKNIFGKDVPNDEINEMLERGQAVFNVLYTRGKSDKLRKWTRWFIGGMDNDER